MMRSLTDVITRSPLRWLQWSGLFSNILQAGVVRSFENTAWCTQINASAISARWPEGEGPRRERVAGQTGRQCRGPNSYGSLERGRPVDIRITAQRIRLRRPRTSLYACKHSMGYTCDQLIYCTFNERDVKTEELHIIFAPEFQERKYRTAKRSRSILRAFKPKENHLLDISNVKK